MRRAFCELQALTAALWIAAAASAQAPVGTTFTYQGRLKDGGGPANGPYDMHFRLYDAATDGAQLGPIICYNNASVADGLFTVALDFGDHFTGQERFLEVAIRVDAGQNCANTSGFTTLSPRQKLTAVPNAVNADRLDGLDSTAFLQSIPNPLTLSGSSASHIIKGENNLTTSGAAAVLGIETGTSGQVYGVYGRSDSSLGRGVYGWATLANSSGSGVYGQSDGTSGYGVYGNATSTGSNPTYGGYFVSRSTNGRAVVGYANAPSGSTHAGQFICESTSGTAVRADANAASGFTYGVYGRSNSTDGCGVAGSASATSGDTMGGYFYSASPDGFGLIATAGANSGTATGVRGQSDSTSGFGVHGWALADTGAAIGVYGQTDSTSGRGVRGIATPETGSTYGGYFESASTSGYGVYGRNSATSGTIYGVRGYASTAAGGYAVYAAGDMGASGAKPFRIDHPLDPENKYLLHYSAESPEVINFYSGKATLDGRGEALVELPAYFASINKDPRYTLTAVGAPMPDLHVAEEISDEAMAAGEQAGPGVSPPGCSFRIAGGAPKGKVSWEVKALRNDLRMRLHGAPVEKEKAAPERGKYQHPEYYGQPREMGVDYHEDHEARVTRGSDDAGR